MRTHAHGQGYADLNWLMPERSTRSTFAKGLISPTKAISVRRAISIFGLIDSVPKAVAQVTAGSFGYRRIFGMDSFKVGDKIGEARC